MMSLKWSSEKCRRKYLFSPALVAIIAQRLSSIPFYLAIKKRKIMYEVQDFHLVA